VQLAGEIGIVPTLLLLIADSIAGTLLMRSQGRSAWQRFNDATAAGRIPAREVADGALIILGGAFLLTPGFVTDIFGFLLLIPPTRRLFRRTVVGLFAKRTPVGYVGYKAAPHAERMWNERAARRRATNGDYVEGTASEVRDDPHGEEPRGDEPADQPRRLEP
jgi:UPF0716 family protein affecting phage T7 exclusion